MIAFEGLYIVCILFTMQLNIVETVLVGYGLHLCDVLIYKYPHALALRRQIVRALTHVATRFRPKDEPHQVYP